MSVDEPGHARGEGPGGGMVKDGRLLTPGKKLRGRKRTRASGETAEKRRMATILFGAVSIFAGRKAAGGARE